MHATNIKAYFEVSYLVYRTSDEKQKARSAYLRNTYVSDAHHILLKYDERIATETEETVQDTDEKKT